MIDQDRLIVRLIGVVTYRPEWTSRARETPAFADRIGLMLGPKGNSERQVRPPMPLVLAIESKIVETHALGDICRERLAQLRKIRVQITVIQNTWVNPALIEGVQRLRAQRSNDIMCVLSYVPMYSFKVCAETESVAAQTLHEIFGELISKRNTVNNAERVYEVTPQIVERSLCVKT